MAINWKRKPQVVLLSGNETYLIDRELESMEEHLAAAYSIHKWQEGHWDEGMLRDQLEESGFFTSNEVLVVWGADRWKAPPSWLERYCEEPESHRVLVLIGTKTRTPKWFGQLKHQEAEECPTIKSYKVPEWLTKEAKRQGLSLSKAFAEVIVLNAGSDLASLAQDIRKLKIYMGARELVTPEDVQMVFVPHGTGNPFLILESWGRGDRKSVLQLIALLCTQSSSDPVLGLIAQLMGHVEKLVRARSLQESGVGQTQIAQKMRMNTYQFTNFKDQLQQRNLVQLMRAYSALCDLDYRIKRGGFSREGLELWVHQTCA